MMFFSFTFYEEEWFLGPAFQSFSKMGWVFILLDYGASLDLVCALCVRKYGVLR
jgi:hypothetical protein